MKLYSKTKSAKSDRAWYRYSICQ